MKMENLNRIKNVLSTMSLKNCFTDFVDSPVIYVGSVCTENKLEVFMDYENNRYEVYFPNVYMTEEQIYFYIVDVISDKLKNK